MYTCAGRDSGTSATGTNLSGRRRGHVDMKVWETAPRYGVRWKRSLKVTQGSSPRIEKDGVQDNKSMKDKPYKSLNERET